jgi:ABC-type sugar transport system ATPase subunit
MSSRERHIGDVILRAENISLAFGGVKALTDVSFDVREHEVRAIIGPNGAGKSSMLNVINGVYTPQIGRIIFRGADGKQASFDHMSPRRAAEMGIARTFQSLALFKGMSVLDNIMTGRNLRMKSNILLQAVRFGPALADTTSAQLSELQLEFGVAGISPTDLQAIELAVTARLVERDEDRARVEVWSVMAVSLERSGGARQVWRTVGVDLDLVHDEREVPVLERDEARRPDRDVLPAGRRPHELASQHAGTQVEAPFVLEQTGAGQVQRLVVDVQLHQRRVRHVDDRLAGPREAVGLLGVHDRPGLVEAVEQRRRLVDRSTLVVHPADADEAVRDGEHALAPADAALVEDDLDEAPRVVRIDVLGQAQQLAGEHPTPVVRTRLRRAGRRPGRTRGCSTRRGSWQGTAGARPRPGTGDRAARCSW